MPNEFSPNLDVAQDTLQPFDVREHEGVSPLIKLAMLAAGLLLAAFIVLILYTPGVRDRSDPPRITADNTPFKVKPENVGGVQTPNQDKVVFDVMDGKSPDAKATPDPRPERPIKIKAPKPVVKTPEPVAEAPKAKAPIAKAPAPAARPIATPAPTRVPTPVTIPANGHSDWVVQVASTRSQADAAGVWSTVKGKFPALIEGKYGDVVRVDLGDKGIYFRTRIAGLADKSAAQSLCNSFKAAGQACFITKK